MATPGIETAREAALRCRVVEALAADGPTPIRLAPGTWGRTGR